jgi:hypothetical protein
MRARGSPPRSTPALAVALVATLAACGDTLVDHSATDLQRGPGSGVCSGDAQVSCRIGGADVCKIEGPTFCGPACSDCTAVVPSPPAGAIAACLPGAAPGGGACGYECTGGLLKCPEGCCPATAVAAGGDHTCAVTSAGALYCWGRNDAGQVSGTPSASPVTTPLKRFDSGAVAVAGGVAHTCVAFASDVRCWGRGLEGQAPEARAIPGVTRLAAGVAHTCALVGSTGEVTCWGTSSSGQDGGGTPVLAGAVTIAAGDDHTCVLIGGGEVRCWGSRELGQLGDGLTGGSSLEPVTAIPSTAGASAIAARGKHTCAAAASPSGGGLTNALRCWGDAPAPALGGASPQPTPAVPLEDPDKAVIEFRVLELATGRTHVCVGKGATDALKCFGPDSANGELGGALVAATETVDVPGSAGAIWLAAGAEHTCAIFPGGGVRCWGSNAAGQLGDGTTATPGLGGDLRPLGTPVAVTGR